MVGHKDVPGRPAMYATTRKFLDYFNLSNLDDLPALAEIKDLDTLTGELKFDDSADATAGNGENGELEEDAAETASAEPQSEVSNQDSDDPADSEFLQAQEDVAEPDDAEESAKPETNQAETAETLVETDDTEQNTNP